MDQRKLKHQTLISALTLAEKASLVTGMNYWETAPVERLGIRSIRMSDGPHGLRKQNEGSDHLGLNASIPATCFPTAATLANSWDQDLLYRIGQAIAAEAECENVTVLLGPGLNIKRNPRGGRNFEYFSEDPYLAGSLAGAFIRGVQSKGIAACPKHFAVNSQETYRMGVDEVVDERALQEIYLEGFRVAIAEGNPWALMTAYNRINGSFAHEHPQLIGEIVRDAWGFDGTIVSDWGGNNDAIAALTVGSNLEMPGSLGITEARVESALTDGELLEDDLDRRLDEFLTLLDRTGGLPAETATPDFDFGDKLAGEAAADSLVLLENRHGTLPLAPGTKVGIIGTFAAQPRFQGAGSSMVNATRTVSALEAMSDSELKIVGYAPGYHKRDRPGPQLAKEALELAQKCDVVTLFLGLDEGSETEGVDRRHLHLARNQLALTKSLIEIGARVVVVLAGGSPVELPFAPHVDAILHSYLAGQAGGQAVSNILTGRVNPSGKLAESYPLLARDVATPDFAAKEASAYHRESLYVGYRYYDKAGLPVRFPFGHGLSYTTFAYSTPQVDADDKPATVTVTITNTGTCPGAEVVQVYSEPVDTAPRFRALRELAGYAKVHLEPGQSETLTIALREHTFDYFNAQTHRWETVGGDYRLLVGASSRDVRQEVTVQVAGKDLVDSAVPPRYRSDSVSSVPTTDFAALLGRTPPREYFDRAQSLTERSFVAELPHHSLLGKAIFSGLRLATALLDAAGQPLRANYLRFLTMMPLRSVLPMTIGKVDPVNQARVIKALNGLRQ